MQHVVCGISSGGRVVPDLDGRRFLVERADGPYIWDADGRRYVDTALGFGATFLGHSAPEVVDAVKRALDRGSMPAYAHALEEEAAARLTAHTRDLTKVVFLNSGSEAVHLACRLARSVTGRSRIAKMAAGYDGWFDDMAFGNAGSRDADMQANHRPNRNGTLLLRFNDFDDVEQLFGEGHDVAAVILEPMLANAGCLPAAEGYLAHVAATARRHGALVIMDEVLMGFRLHAGLAGHLFGVTPDLATIGKAIGNGIAVAALLGTPDAMAAFEQGRVNRAGTYNGNPVACAAVQASMNLLDKVDYAALSAKGDRLRAEAVGPFAARGVEICTTGYGQVFTIWRGDRPPVTYTEAARALDPGFTAGLHLALRKSGVMSMPSNYGRHYLSPAHDVEALTIGAEAFRQAAAAMAAAG